MAPSAAVISRLAWLGSLSLACVLAPSRADAERSGLSAARLTSDTVLAARPSSAREEAELRSAALPPVAIPLDTGKAKESEITFLGYRQLQSGGGIVFVELSDAVAVEVSRAGQVLEYRLVGARVPLKNNRNPLLLRDFGASALSAVLVPDKRSVRLVITLREAMTPPHRLVRRDRGVALEIELPAPSQR